MFNFIFEFDKEVENVKKKDIRDIKKSKMRLEGVDSEDKTFLKKVSGIHSFMQRKAHKICGILEELIDNPVGELVIKKPFSKASVISVLQDKEFAAFMVVANLANRTFNLKRKSRGDFKVRLYIAILNFDEYQKSRWCE